MQGTRFQITTKTDAQRNDVVSRVDKTLMNHVEAARSLRGIFPNVRGMWGIIRDVLVNVMSNRCQTLLRCRPSSSIPTEEFLPLRSRIAPDSLPGASQSVGGIRSTPQVSWLVSGINTPEGSCAVEEFCCNEFAAALLTPGGCLP